MSVIRCFPGNSCLICCLAACGLLSGLGAQTTSVIQGTVVDPQQLPIQGARVSARSPAAPLEVASTTDEEGRYRLAGLSSGVYHLRVSGPGFSEKVFEQLSVTVNRVITFDVELPVNAVQETLSVPATPPLLDPGISSTGATILPRQIEEMPLDGRNYLDLMQLVPGITISKNRDPGGDSATAILGERGGNAIFLIEGMPNSNVIDGGPASPFDQNAILEFQVLTAGYKAEFGHGSGGVINVVSKSGTAGWHGLLSGFHRNSALDSSNISGMDTPFLQRWDAGANLGGPIVSDRVFFFGSIERIRENRQLNFRHPPNFPEFLQAREERFNQYSRTFQTRGFARLDETLGRHRFTQFMNLTNSHTTNFLPLSQALSLPSTRTNLDSRHLMLGFRDTAMLGDQGNPFLLNAWVQYRGEPFTKRAAHPEASPATTIFNMFSGYETGGLFGDLGQVQFGSGATPLVIEPWFAGAGAQLNKAVGAHDVKFGWEFQRSHVDGVEASNRTSQLFATQADFSRFGPVNAGPYVLSMVAGQSARENLIRLRNNHQGLFIQDDWRLRSGLTLNAGLRWDYDSRFPNRANFSPRLGVAWSATPRTLVTASWGVFYDRFRLGLARDVPDFGGANLFTSQTLSFPRLLYGVPTTLPWLFGLCPSPVLTDAEITVTGPTCPAGPMPLLGVDRLNNVVAPGHAPIPANSVVTIDNVQALTGFTPEEFADAASAAVGRPPGAFFWGGFGNLTMHFPVPQVFNIPIAVDPQFKTPYTRAVHVGVQREITSDLVIHAAYHHRDIRNMLGVRATNLAFEARLPGSTGQLQPGSGSRPVQTYGPWYRGRYDGVILGLRKRMTRNLSVEAFYTWTDAIDNAFRSSFVSDVQTLHGAAALGSNGPTDAFVGVPPVVQDPETGQTNENSAFVASNGNPVPKAGVFYNGPDLDRGPSDLALKHTFVVHGTTRLPRQFDVGGIFRLQSGFPYSAMIRRAVDVDGDGLFNGVDFVEGRNALRAPHYANLDLRVSRRFSVGERLRIRALVEAFNVLNRDNPAAVQQFQDASPAPGTPLQLLPGREIQLGLRVEF